MGRGMTTEVRARRLVDLRRVFRSEFTGFTKAMAELGAARIKRNLYAQTYGHAPLNPRYRRWKVKRGLDPRILIATGAYADSITARQQRQDMWLIAPRAGAMHGRRAMSTLALWFEYGTARMPSRPHYRIEAARLRGDIQVRGARKLQRIVARIAASPMVKVG